MLLWLGQLIGKLIFVCVFSLVCLVIALSFSFVVYIFSLRVIEKIVANGFLFFSFSLSFL